MLGIENPKEYARGLIRQRASEFTSRIRSELFGKKDILEIVLLAAGEMAEFVGDILADVLKDNNERIEQDLICLGVIKKD